MTRVEISKITVVTAVTAGIMIAMMAGMASMICGGFNLRLKDRIVDSMAFLAATDL